MIWPPARFHDFAPGLRHRHGRSLDNGDAIDPVATPDSIAGDLNDPIDGIRIADGTAVRGEDTVARAMLSAPIALGV